MVIGFAGAMGLTSGVVNIQAVLANGTAGQMDAVSEHTYSELWLPEKNYPLQVSAIRTVLTAGGCPANIPSGTPKKEFTPLRTVTRHIGCLRPTWRNCTRGTL